jgi:hypothetical protein
MLPVKVRGIVPARVLAAVVAGGVVVAAGIALLVVNIVHLRTTSDRTIKSDSYLTATTNVENLVVDAETGLRGYVITRDPVFLQAAKSAQNRIGSATGGAGTGSPGRWLLRPSGGVAEPLACPRPLMSSERSCAS